MATALTNQEQKITYKIGRKQFYRALLIFRTGSIDVQLINNKIITMIHQHNHSTLLASKRRAVYYPPTGTGRDTYIMTDNGGTNITYKCQGVPELGNFMKFGPNSRAYKPCSYTRFQKYISDGTGRDQYVVSHHGGQYNQEDECNLLLRKFRDTMRDGGWKNRTEAEGWRVTKQKNRDRALSEYQRTQTTRLSAPKRTEQKYEQTLQQFRKTYFQKK